jgi:hypothetical protein
MKRLTNWIAGIVSGVIAYRLWKQRQKPAAATTPAAEESDDRAEELRAKLAEARASEEPAPVEPTVPTEQSAEQPGELSGESLEERRRRVHEEGRAAIDQMNDN